MTTDTKFLEIAVEDAIANAIDYNIPAYFQHASSMLTAWILIADGDELKQAIEDYPQDFLTWLSSQTQS